MFFDFNPLTIAHQKSKGNDLKKNYYFLTEIFIMSMSSTPCILVISSMWEGKKMSHMEAQKSKSYYKAYEKTT